MIVVGIDPGGRETGYAMRRGDDCLRHDVLVRHTGGKNSIADREYLESVLALGQDFLDDAAKQDEDGDVHLASEWVYAPHGRRPDGSKAMMSSGALMSVAGVTFGVAARWPHVRLVRPGTHGSNLPTEWARQLYPVQLLPTRGNGKGADLLRHARSAFDIAGAAIKEISMERRFAR